MLDLLPPLPHKGLVVLDLFHQAAEHDLKGRRHLLPEPGDDLCRVAAQGNQVVANLFEDIEGIVAARFDAPALDQIFVLTACRYSAQPRR